jgi:hypothetical protein
MFVLARRSGDVLGVFDAREDRLLAEEEEKRLLNILRSDFPKKQIHRAEQSKWTWQNK